MPGRPDIRDHRGEVSRKQFRIRCDRRTQRPCAL